MKEKRVRKTVRSIWKKDMRTRKSVPRFARDIKLEKQVQYGTGSQASFVWIIDGKQIDMERSPTSILFAPVKKMLLTQGIVPKGMGKDRWSRTQEAIFETMTEVRDALTRNEDVDEMLDSFLTGAARVTFEGDLQKALRTDSFNIGFTFIAEDEEGSLYFSIRAFVDWVNTKHGLGLSSMAAGIILRKHGVEKLGQKVLGEEGKKRTVVWKLDGWGLEA